MAVVSSNLFEDFELPNKDIVPIPYDFSEGSAYLLIPVTIEVAVAISFVYGVAKVQ